MQFYLGTHRPNWLAEMAIPLFVARQSLAPRKTLPRAMGTWYLDSGAFSEITLRGGVDGAAESVCQRGTTILS